MFTNSRPSSAAFSLATSGPTCALGLKNAATSGCPPHHASKPGLSLPRAQK